MDVKKCVLIVDDEPQIGKIFGLKLKLSGYNVITTTSGANAIEIILAKEPDVVLLDILMPGVTGIDVLNKVRTFSQVPIIVFTADGNVLQLAMKLGANDYITKPCDPDHVMKKVEDVLVSHSQKL